MFNFLHTFSPNPILISFGPITVYWYGLFVVSGIIAAFYIILKLAEYYDLEKNTIVDIGFWIVLWGIVGARLYHVGLEFSYYYAHPINIFKIWNGGLAIHGAIIAGALTGFYLVKKHEISFWKLASICVPGIALGQAIGRWGNYFNQELYGLPTGLPWGIPIDPINKMPEYYNYAFFHPTFIYESIGNIFIFIILISLQAWMINRKKQSDFYLILSISLYLMLYSVLRFSTEFLRIDFTPTLLALRFPQLMSIILFLVSALFLAYTWKKQKK
ncbi:MAG: prolipoprotein diacylglyceryl transferase, partial [Candidatus Magasanikbacteria bacterium]|nr:prolipoprotein diacylglyceryl transferase [Candidatus Magasanikbacteria bacterium]